MVEKLTEFRVKVLIADLESPSEIRQKVAQELSQMPFLTPVDFVFDAVNLRMALAIDFESHPLLAEQLQALPGQGEARLIGGRFGRTPSGQFATSEWSGHYGEAWDDTNRAFFVHCMQVFGITIVHRAWYKGQTANEVG